MDKSQRIGVVLLVLVTVLWFMYADRQRRVQEAAARRAAEAAEAAEGPEGPEGGEGGEGGEGVAPAADAAEDADAPAASAGADEAPPSATAPAEAPPTAPAEAGAPAAPGEPDWTAPARPEEVRVRGPVDPETGEPSYLARFSSRGACLLEYTLGRYYRSTDHQMPLSLLSEALVPNARTFLLTRLSEVRRPDEVNYEILERPGDATDPAAPRRLVFRAVQGRWRITKTFTFGPRRLPPPDEAAAETPRPARIYGFRLQVAIENLAAEARPVAWSFVPLAGLVPDDPNARFGAIQAVAATAGGAETGADLAWHSAAGLVDNPAEEPAGNLLYVALKGRFFTTILRSEQPELSAAYRLEELEIPLEAPALQENEALAEAVNAQPRSARFVWQMLRSPQPLASGGRQESAFFFYGGPVREEELAAVDPDFTPLVTYSLETLAPISRFLSQLLNWLYAVIPNFGVCIILLTLLIKTSMHGLTRRALASGHQMQKLQPKIKELREKYKDDQTKLHQETMRLWREHGVSPWGSCLPMLIQIPVFFALYGTFARDFAIRQALFIPGWIEDLSQPDALFDLPFVVPLLGWTNFNLLPILYVAMQLFHQSMTPKSEDPNVAQQQQMMKIMPILFMFIFYPMPSGLVLYFTVSACYTAVEHWFIRRRLDAGETQAAGAPAAAGQGIGNEGGKGGKRKKKKR